MEMRWALLCLRAGLVLLIATLAPSASAHGGDTSYVVLTPNGAATIDGTVNLDLPDAEGILHVTRKELIDGQKREVVGDYLVSHFTLTDGADPCPIVPALDTMTFDLRIQRFVFKFTAHCPRVPQRLAVGFDIFFDAAGYYLGYVRVEGARKDVQLFMASRRTGSVSVGQPTVPSAASAAPSAGVGTEPRPPGAPARWSWRALTSAIGIGVTHIWSGADHMLFLLALLMTSVVERRDGAWTPRASLRACLVDVAKIVTGFTVTHSVTLSLAALGFLRPAARLIEPAIAASVAVAAFDNLRPFLRGRKWLIASSLGLLHGFGFASALNELALPKESLLMTLVGFGMGVEIGQAIFVSAFVPAAFVLRRTSFYRRWVLLGGSVAIALIAVVWMVQRVVSPPRNGLLERALPEEHLACLVVHPRGA